MKNPYIDRITFKDSRGCVLDGNSLESTVKILAITSFVKMHKAGLITSIDLEGVEFV